MRNARNFQVQPPCSVKTKKKMGMTPPYLFMRALYAPLYTPSPRPHPFRPFPQGGGAAIPPSTPSPAPFPRAEGRLYPPPHSLPTPPCYLLNDLHQTEKKKSKGTTLQPSPPSPFPPSPSSALHNPSSALRNPSSTLRNPSSALHCRPPPSITRPPPSVTRPPPRRRPPKPTTEEERAKDGQ